MIKKSIWKKTTKDENRAQDLDFHLQNVCQTVIKVKYQYMYMSGRFGVTVGVLVTHAGQAYFDYITCPYPQCCLLFFLINTQLEGGC